MFTKNRGTALPEPSTYQTVEFSLMAPEARDVRAAGSFCDWATDSVILKKDKKGVWTASLSLPPGRYEYRFLVNGQWSDDPNCTERVANGFGSQNCVLNVMAEAPKASRSAARTAKK